jgi:predicted ABC-type transport system involved in lysophospholipase L1 biosynthesis ATPase subunit
MIAVDAVDLCKWYGPESARVHALRGVTLQVQAGERIALLGKSGSGKSTLLNLVGGLDRASSGHLHVTGLNIAKLSETQRARHRLAGLGMIFQSFNLIPSKSALHNVMLPLVFAGLPPSQRRDRATDILKAVGLGERLHHRPTQLSGGEQQRVALARALVNRPQILLADEPTGNLDSSTAREVMDLLLDHVRTVSATLLLVTHDEELARRCTDRVVRLHDGRVL